LISVLEGGPEDVRKEAALSLGRIGGAGALAALLEALSSDPSFEVRWRAAMMIGHIGDQEAVALLMKIRAKEVHSFVIEQIDEASTTWTRREVDSMSILKRCSAGAGLSFLILLAGIFVFAQGNIDFGDVPIGETKTVTYTFKILESSSTPGIVTGISLPGGPFESFKLQNLPALPATIQPGNSISFQVVFSPRETWTYVSSFTITVEVGTPLQMQMHAITLTGQGVASPRWPPVPPPKLRTVLEIAPEVAELVTGNTEFAFDLYQAIRRTKGNLFYSPYSLSLALAMTYAGARSTTEEQMAEVLHFMLPQEDFHPALQTLSLVVASRGADPEVQLTIANSLWVQTGYPFLPTFLDLLATNYDAAPRHVDFLGAPGEACDAVNEWVSRETEGKIQNLLDPGAITSYTRLVLANAIYFKVDWLHQFSKAATRDGPFYLLDGSEVIASMMEQEEDFRYTRGDGYQAIELPYCGEELSMVILIPKKAAEQSDSGPPRPPTPPGPSTPPPTGPIDPVHFEEFEQSLDAERFASIVTDLRLTTVHLIMPKFTYESSFNLGDTLVDMGMTDAFKGKVADFSGMDGTRLLYISDVLHKAFVAVDEEGTEAVAATVIPVAAIGLPPEPVQLTIDCPFIFVIRDVETGAILFVGRVLDPRAH
jgi:serpin B